VNAAMRGSKRRGGRKKGYPGLEKEGKTATPIGEFVAERRRVRKPHPHHKTEEGKGRREKVVLSRKEKGSGQEKNSFMTRERSTEGKRTWGGGAKAGKKHLGLPMFRKARLFPEEKS